MEPTTTSGLSSWGIILSSWGIAPAGLDALAKVKKFATHLIVIVKETLPFGFWPSVIKIFDGAMSYSNQYGNSNCT